MIEEHPIVPVLCASPHDAARILRALAGSDRCKPVVSGEPRRSRQRHYDLYGCQRSGSFAVSGLLRYRPRSESETGPTRVSSHCRRAFTRPCSAALQFLARTLGGKSMDDHSGGSVQRPPLPEATTQFESGSWSFRLRSPSPFVNFQFAKHGCQHHSPVYYIK